MPTAREPSPNAASPRRSALAGVRRASVELLVVLTTAGCAVHRGEWRGERAMDAAAPAAAAAKAAPRLLVIGDLGGAVGRGGEAIEEAIGRRLDAAAAAGAPVILVGVGDDLVRCAPANPAAHDLAATLAARRVAGFVAAGEGERACGGPSERALWTAPAANYVVRVGQDGAARVVSRCEGESPRCAVEDDPGALLDLVFIDTVAWQVGPVDDPASARSLAEAAALLDALAAKPGPERLLVTHHPIESAGPHGMGGRWPDSALHFHAPPLQRAIVEGRFAGAISGHEHTLQAAADITPAVKRSSRTWLHAPFFQVVAGAAADGDTVGRRAWPAFRGRALFPDQVSAHPGFAELELHPDRHEVTLHARRHGRWQAAALTIPRGRPPHPRESASPVMDPCAGCDPTAPRW